MGLDCPPLTAYHSWLLGKVGAFADPSWLALHTSRGVDNPTLKIFMRDAVIVSEYLVYIPAAAIFVRSSASSKESTLWTASIALTAILLLANVGFLRYTTKLQQSIRCHLA
jgi:alpha-1,3-glucosyltransferase